MSGPELFALALAVICFAEMLRRAQLWAGDEPEMIMFRAPLPEVLKMNALCFAGIILLVVVASRALADAP